MEAATESGEHLLAGRTRRLGDLIDRLWSSRSTSPFHRSMPPWRRANRSRRSRADPTTKARPPDSGSRRRWPEGRSSDAMTVESHRPGQPTPTRGDVAWLCVDKALPGYHVADMHDARAQFDHRKHRICRTGRRVYPEQRRVGAHQIEVRLAMQQRGGGAGQRGRNAAIKATHFVEPGKLAVAPFPHRTDCPSRA